MPRINVYSEVGRALGECQALELELKTYITRAFDVVRSKTKGVIAFQFEGSDYEDAALGKLLQVFRKLNANRNLQRELTEFMQRRNRVAHRAIVDCIDQHEGEFDRIEIRKLKPEMDRIREDARRLTKLVYEESMPFLGDYYFGEEDEEIT